MIENEVPGVYARLAVERAGPDDVRRSDARRHRDPHGRRGRRHDLGGGRSAAAKLNPGGGRESPMGVVAQVWPRQARVHGGRVDHTVRPRKGDWWEMACGRLPVDRLDLDRPLCGRPCPGCAQRWTPRPCASCPGTATAPRKPLTRSAPDRRHSEQVHRRHPAQQRRCAEQRRQQPIARLPFSQIGHVGITGKPRATHGQPPPPDPNLRASDAGEPPTRTTACACAVPTPGVAWVHPGRRRAAADPPLRHVPTAGPSCTGLRRRAPPTRADPAR